MGRNMKYLSQKSIQHSQCLSQLYRMRISITLQASILLASSFFVRDARSAPKNHCLCVINDIADTYVQEIPSGQKSYDMNVKIKSQEQHESKKLEHKAYLCTYSTEEVNISVSFKHSKEWVFQASPQESHCGSDKHSYVQLTCVNNNTIQATLFSYDDGKGAWESKIIDSWVQPTVWYYIKPFHKGEAGLLCK